MWFYKQPVDIHFGNGALEKLGEIATKLGVTRGVLVCDPYWSGNGLVDKLVKQHNGLLFAIYDNVCQNPTIVNVDECAALLRDIRADFVVALGGGSAIDCAKAAATMATCEGSVAAYHATGVAMPAVHLPLIAVTTTSGTGAEVTCSAVLTNEKKGFKAPILSDNFYPVAAIVDPRLTYSVPRRVAVGTGLDVLAHAVEGYMSVNHQPICDAVAVQAAQLVFTYLEAACDEKLNELAKEKMSEASVMAGMAFSLPKTGASHACSFVLTNRFGIHHGEACGLTLDYFVRINADCENGRMHQFAKQLGFLDCIDLSDGIAKLKVRLGARTDLHDLGLNTGDLETLVQGSHHPNMNNSPTPITDEMLREMYLAFL